MISMDKWAELDEPISVEKGLGKEGYKALLGKIRPLIVQAEANEYRFQPELSYLPPQNRKQAKPSAFLLKQLLEKFPAVAPDWAPLPTALPIEAVPAALSNGLSAPVPPPPSAYPTHWYNLIHRLASRVHTDIQAVSTGSSPLSYSRNIALAIGLNKGIESEPQLNRGQQNQ